MLRIRIRSARRAAGDVGAPGHRFWRGRGMTAVVASGRHRNMYGARIGAADVLVIFIRRR